MALSMARFFLMSQSSSLRILISAGGIAEVGQSTRPENAGGHLAIFSLLAFGQKQKIDQNTAIFSLLAFG